MIQSDTPDKDKSFFAKMYCPDCGIEYLTYACEYHCIFCHNNNLNPIENKENTNKKGDYYESNIE